MKSAKRWPSEPDRPTMVNEVAIVTGAGRGLGEAIAKELAHAGARVAVNDINPDRAERVAREIRAAAGQAIGVMADVANKFQAAHLVETTRAEWGRLDYLVNCAAVQPHATILQMDEWDWNRCLEVNLKGTFFMSQLCGRVMADENGEQGGAIVNLASTAGMAAPLAGGAAYCAGSAGVVGFTRECAREFAGYHIRVNAVVVDRQAANDGAGLAGVANLVRFLLSDEAVHIAGGVINVGGSLALT